MAFDYVKQPQIILELPRVCIRRIIELLDRDVTETGKEESKFAIVSLIEQSDISITLKNRRSDLIAEFATILDPESLWTPPNSRD